MSIKNMVIGGMYLVNDGYGYDRVKCVSILNQEEMKKEFGEVYEYAVRISYIDEPERENDVYFENGVSLFVEPISL